MLFSVSNTVDGGDGGDGGQGAFGLFVKENEKLMFKAADGILHNYHDSEEAVYSALAAVARNFSSVSALAPSERSAYAWRAARSHALNIYKKRKKREKIEIPIDDIADIGEPDAELERIAADDRVSVDVIYEQMKSVPALYRDPLILHFADGMDAKTIARELGIKYETAKTRLKRGKKLLAEKLKKEVGIE